MGKRGVTPRCPRCRSKHLRLTEVCEELGHIGQTADGRLETWGGSGARTDLVFEAGAVIAVRARCFTCGHNWRVRSMRQITDHADYDEAPKGAGEE